MFNSAVIVFREVLEIALILSVILAATRGLAGRFKWSCAGIGLGVAGSFLVALFAERIAAAAEGMGQEIFNASILFTAALVIGWTVVWMKRHGRAIAQKMRAMGHAIKEGDTPMYSIAIVIALAVLREGSEIVLFSYGLIAQGSSVFSILAGGAMGLLGGGLVGWMLYRGLLNLSPKHMFSVTGWLLILLSAGMMAHGAGFLSAAGVLPDLIPTVWDSSKFLSETSVVGQLLHVLIGYIAQPSGIQLLFYTGTIALLGFLLHWFGKPPAQPKFQEKPAT